MNAPNPGNRKMTAPAVSKQQKDAQAWIKLRAKRAAAVATKSVKHGKNPARKPCIGALDREVLWPRATSRLSQYTCSFRD
jgi:hypothetical protein